MFWEHTVIVQLQFLTHSWLGRELAIGFARYSVFLLVAWALVRERTTKDKRVRHMMHEAGWSGFFALFLALTTSHFLERVRPFAVFPDISLLVSAPLSQFALPSAHTAFSFGIATACLWGATVQKDIIAPVILASLVGLGRILVGVHYPTDVIAGIGVGVFAYGCVRTMHYVVRSVYPHRV